MSGRKPKLSNTKRLDRIAAIIQEVDRRGWGKFPCPSAAENITMDDLRRLYALACGKPEEWLSEGWLKD